MSGTAPLEVNFTNQSSGATDYSWNFGNNSTLTTTQTINPASTFTTVGTYTVELNGTDAVSGCQSSYRLIIEVIEGSSLEVPNVFTPNEDGANDVFKIICTGITELSCEIYNRWGTKVYEITSAGDSWDGAENSAGTYFYILNAKGKDAKEYSSKGFITMFK
jgi:gliding motility-associated-like protein